MEQIVDIATEGRHLSRDRGFLKVSEKGDEVGRVPLDQIAAVIVHAHGVTYTNSLLAELAARGASLVICSANHQPQAILWPLQGSFAQGARMRAQWTAKAPLRKQAWKSIVSAKVTMQAAALESVGETSGALRRLATTVRSGDPENVEAQAARRYWPLMMGSDFRRDPAAPGVNGLLNYGYTVLRAATARAVVGAGLNPTIGVHHANRSNAFALADDLMEPFRPLVDRVARSIVDDAGPEMTSEAKQTFARLIAADVGVDGANSPLSVALQRLSVSLAQSFVNGDLALALPRPLTPIQFAGLA